MERIEKIAKELDGFEGLVALELGGLTVIGFYDFSKYDGSSRELSRPLLVDTGYTTPDQDEYETILKKTYANNQHNSTPIEVNNKEIFITYTL